MDYQPNYLKRTYDICATATTSLNEAEQATEIGAEAPNID